MAIVRFICPDCGVIEGDPTSCIVGPGHAHRWVYSLVCPSCLRRVTKNCSLEAANRLLKIGAMPAYTKFSLPPTDEEADEFARAMADGNRWQRALAELAEGSC